MLDTDKKLTDNEIVKALECWLEAIRKSRQAYLEKVNEEHYPSMRYEYLLSDTIHEINRLQAENENYSKNNQTMTKDILDLYKALEKAKAENERLQLLFESVINSRDGYIKVIEQYKAENERLKPFEDKIAEFNSHIRVEDMLVFASSLEEWLEFCENLKAEAYKEFADKMLTEIHQALDSNYKARAERIERHNVGETDEFISYCQGKIDALRGIGDFVDEEYKELVGDNDAEEKE